MFVRVQGHSEDKNSAITVFSGSLAYGWLYFCQPLLGKMNNFGRRSWFAKHHSVAKWLWTVIFRTGRFRLEVSSEILT
jgi:hypothetical protein